MEAKKIHITREMYEDRGFSAIPESSFRTFITRAGYFIQEQTLKRVLWSIVPITVDEPLDEVKERNIYGICELAELFFRSEAAVGENGAAIISFANEGYREVYEAGTRSGSSSLFEGRLSRIMSAYFTTEQLSRRQISTRKSGDDYAWG